MFNDSIACPRYLFSWRGETLKSTPIWELTTGLYRYGGNSFSLHPSGKLCLQETLFQWQLTKVGMILCIIVTFSTRPPSTYLVSTCHPPLVVGRGAAFQRKPPLPTILRAAVDRGATLVASIGIKLQSRFRVRDESPALIITTCYKPLALKPSDKWFNNQNFKKALNLLHDIWRNFPSINTLK
jgi:hypothetical protein